MCLFTRLDYQKCATLSMRARTYMQSARRLHATQRYCGKYALRAVRRNAVVLFLAPAHCLAALLLHLWLLSKPVCLLLYALLSRRCCSLLSVNPTTVYCSILFCAHHFPVTAYTLFTLLYFFFVFALLPGSLSF